MPPKIQKAKKNIHVSKAWNKRADNKFEKILKEKGEEYTIKILDILYNDLNSDINKTLVAYINGVLKNLTEEEKEEMKKPKKKIGLPPEKEVEEAEIVEETEEVVTKEVDHIEDKSEEKNTELSDPLSILLWETYEKMDQKEKDDIKNKAREKYLKTTNSKQFNTIHEKIFAIMEKVYIVEIVRKEKGL